MADADLALFAHLARRPDEALDLAQAALLVAEPFRPGLDIPRYLAVLDGFAAQAKGRLASVSAVAGVDGIARSICRLLYEELGFAGNEANYFDPDNSFLDRVIDRRTGIPITLAVVLVEVARRAGVVAHGVGFPGHFLVRMEGEAAAVFVDPFRGRLLGPDDLRSLHRRVTGHAGDPDPRLLAPSTNRQILLRMLNNLRLIFAEHGERRLLREVLRRMQVLAPADEQLAAQLHELERTPPEEDRGGIN